MEKTGKSSKRNFEGVVVSNKMQKTVVVEMKKRVKHPLFKKYYTVRKKYMAHDEMNVCQLGDTVMIRESRPLSRHKRWVVVQVLGKAA